MRIALMLMVIINVGCFGPSLPSLAPSRSLHQIILDNRSDKELEQVLAAGADPNFKDMDGNTPLILAAKNHRGDLVRTLIRYPADVTLRNNQGKVALDLIDPLPIEEVVKNLKSSRNSKPFCGSKRRMGSA